MTLGHLRHLRHRLARQPAPGTQLAHPLAQRDQEGVLGLAGLVGGKGGAGIGAAGIGAAGGLHRA